MEGSVSEEELKSVKRVADASQGSTECRRLKRKRVKKKRASGLDALKKDAHLGHAKIALEFYEKSQDAEFEILEVLYSHGSRLRLPESASSQLWGHVCFIAKPKNADCSNDVSPKHFLGELFRDDCSRKFKTTYCSTFEPSDDPGFNHGCIICPRVQKFHPSDGYCVGRPPWYIQKKVYGPTPAWYIHNGRAAS